MTFIARYFGLSLIRRSHDENHVWSQHACGLAQAAERCACRAVLLANRRGIWRAVNGVMERQEVADELSSIKAPTLVVLVQREMEKSGLSVSESSRGRILIAPLDGCALPAAELA
jgi:hypothetical protein